MERKLALKVDDLDNVATIFAEGIVDGTKVEVRDKKGNSQCISVIGNIPYGHKIALCDMGIGCRIIKYGECIGEAVKPIKTGECVHVHNLNALRGRGDLQEGNGNE